MKKSKGTRSSRKQIITEDKEKQWYIPPTNGIPQYRAENDPNCPVGRIGNFNRKQKQKVQAIPDTHKTAEWIKQKLDRKYDEVPMQIHVNLATKALDEANGPYNLNRMNRPSVAEVEILQKIIVRERLLTELARLVRSTSDITTVMGEIVELVKALRFETVDIVEDISQWQTMQPTPRPFLFKGMNYLVKVSCDLDFLDQHDEVIEAFCFEFKSNPFAYRGGGNVITGAGRRNTDTYLQALLVSYYQNGPAAVDGVEVSRLHNAEKVIQGEFNRLATQGDIQLQYSALSLLHGSVSADAVGQLDETGHSATSAAATESPTLTRPRSSGGSGRLTRGGVTVFSAKKLKLERVATLRSEVDELSAIVAHIKEKIALLGTEHGEAVREYRQLELKLAEAQRLGRESAAQHCTTELVVRRARLTELSAEVKELQRELYFVGLERKRKAGVMQSLAAELDEQRSKAALKKKLQDAIRTKGLSAALELLSAEKPAQTATQTQGASGKKGKKGKKQRRKSADSDSKAQKTKTKTQTSGAEDQISGYLGRSQSMDRIDEAHCEEEEEEEEDDEEGEDEGEYEDGADGNEAGEGEEGGAAYDAAADGDYGGGGGGEEEGEAAEGAGRWRYDDRGDDDNDDDHDDDDGGAQDTGADDEDENGVGTGLGDTGYSAAVEDHAPPRQHSTQSLPDSVHSSGQLSARGRVGYISDDEEEGGGGEEDGEQSELEVSADYSVGFTPAGSAFQAAKLLSKQSPRPI